MKMFFFSLIIAFFFFINSSVIVFSQSATIPGTGGAVSISVPGQSNNSQSEQQKADEKGIEALSSSVEDFIKEKDVGCGKVGQKCCTKAFLQNVQVYPNNSEIKVHFTIDWLLNLLRKKGLIGANNTDTNTQILKDLPEFGLACVDDSYPKYADPENPNPNACFCSDHPFKLQELCSKIGEPNKPSNERNQCEIESNNAIWTAIGPIDFTLQGFVKDVLMKWGIGLAGTLALLCIIYSAFVMQTSGGNPEKLKKAKERLTACIVGLLLIIFSVFILQIIGVDILQIPGFSK
ncbi:MAG TPA: pilin [Patescibacteria group bacterium]|nr:pilin [Patescibacteria group bacterium]